MARPLLDLALQMPSTLMKEEKLLRRSPLFATIGQDAVLMVDAQISERMARLDQLYPSKRKKKAV